MHYFEIMNASRTVIQLKCQQFGILLGIIEVCFPLSDSLLGCKLPGFHLWPHHSDQQPHPDNRALFDLPFCQQPYLEPYVTEHLLDSCFGSEASNVQRFALCHWQDLFSSYSEPKL